MPGSELDMAAPRGDIQPAAASIAGVHRQALRPTIAYQSVEDALDALLVELVVVAEGDQVAQQRFASAVTLVRDRYNGRQFNVCEKEYGP